MLRLMRLAAQNIFFKALLIFIIVSFAIFGIGDIFRSNHDSVIEINGKTAVNVYDFEKVKRNEIHKLQQLLGSNLTAEQLQSLNIDNIILHRLINDKLLELETQNLNIVISDDTAATYIKSEQIFHDETGVFDKKKFMTLLASNGIKEQSYIDLVKKDIATKFLIDTIRKQSIPLAKLAKYTYDYQTEKRIADIIQISSQNVVIDKPTDEELTTFYTEHKDKFFAPEYRKFSYIIITAKGIAHNLTFSDDELKKEYEKTIADYQKPETRNILNYIFDTQEHAKEASQNLQFDSATKNSFLKNVTKEQLPQELSDIAFSLKEGEVSSVIKSEFGFHIIKVQAIFPAQVLSFEEAKNSINSNLLDNLAEKKLIELRKVIEDEIAAGTNLNEIVTTIKLNSLLKTVDLVDHNGNDLNNNPVLDSKSLSYILNSVFTAPVNNEVIGVLPDNNGYFVLAVQQILPSQAKPFGAVKEEVADSLYKHKQEQEAIKIASDFYKKLKANIALKDILSSIPIAQLLPNKTIHRFKEQNDITVREFLPTNFREELFKIAVNDITTIHTDNSGHKLIGILKSVEHRQDVDHTLMESITTELHERFETSLIEEYLNYLRQKYTIKINHNFIKNDN